MSRPDFVRETLRILDHNWSQSSYTVPTPILVDGRDQYRVDADRRDPEIDRAEGTIVTVTPGPVDNAPVGTDYNVDYDELVSVHVEGLHWERGGDVGDENTRATEDWHDRYEEVKRAINASRERPTPQSDLRVRHLIIRDADPRSAAAVDVFERSFNVAFVGYETLS